MLTKYKEVRPKKGVNKPFEKCFHVWDVFRNFFRDTQFRLIFKRSFFADLFQSIVRMRKAVGGSGGMLPRKFSEILHAVGAILVLFEQVLGKFCLNFLSLILSVAPNMMHFVRTFSIMRRLLRA